MSAAPIESSPSDLLTVMCAVAIVAAVPLLTICLALFERALRVRMRSRFGAAQTGHASFAAEAFAIFQGAATLDAIPSGNGGLCFWIGPFASFFFAVLGLAAMAFAPIFRGAGSDAAIAIILAAGACSGFAVLLAKLWGPEPLPTSTVVRGAMQFGSCGAAAVLGLISVLLLAGTLSVPGIAQAQSDQGAWFLAFVPVGFAIYMFGSVSAMQGALCSTAEFDIHGLAPGDSPGAAGFRGFLLRASGAANVFTVSGLAAMAFLGGWQRPLARYHDHLLGTSVELLDALPPVLFLLAGGACLRRAFSEREYPAARIWRVACSLCVACGAIAAGALFFPEPELQAIHGVFWFAAKVLVCVLACLWIDISIESIRFDQWMKLAWKFLVPLAIANLLAVGLAIVLRQNWGWGPGLSFTLATIATLAVALRLISPRRSETPNVMAVEQPDAAE